MLIKILADGTYSVFRPGLTKVGSEKREAGEVINYPKDYGDRLVAMGLGIEVKSGQPEPGKADLPEPVESEELESREGINATPSAIRRAESSGIDIATVKGTGAGGRVTVEDVLGAIIKAQEDVFTQASA